MVGRAQAQQSDGEPLEALPRGTADGKRSVFNDMAACPVGTGTGVGLRNGGKLLRHREMPAPGRATVRREGPGSSSLLRSNGNVRYNAWSGKGLRGRQSEDGPVDEGIETCSASSCIFCLARQRMGL